MRILIILTCLAFSSQHIDAQQVKKKDYEDGVPIEKGLWFTSGTLSLGDRKAENENQLFVYNINQKKSDFEIRLDAGHVIRENFAIGLGLLYGNNKEENLQQSSDGIMTSNNIAGNYFAFRPFVKNFIPLGKSNRFYVVIPTELQIGFGSTIKESVTDNVLTRNYTTANYYGLAMRPGMLAFIYKNFGFEVNVGAFGLGRRVEKTETTNQPNGRVVTNDLDLKINVLNLSLGFAGYF
jgi:hypothetical protein